MAEEDSYYGSDPFLARMGCKILVWPVIFLVVWIGASIEKWTGKTELSDEEKLELRKELGLDSPDPSPRSQLSKEEQFERIKSSPVEGYLEGKGRLEPAEEELVSPAGPAKSP